MQDLMAGRAKIALALDEAAIVAVTDAGGRIVYCNDKFCEISGYPASDLLGKTHRVINSGYHPKSFFREMFATVADGSVWRGVICNRNRDGSHYWVDTTIVPTLGRDNRPAFYTAIRFDVTSHVQAVDALRLARLEAERAAAVRDRFIANMSHEVRTPLNGILGLASALSLTHLDDGQRSMVELITRSGDTLRRVLDDVLDVSRMGAGELRLTPAPLDVRADVSAAAELMGALALEKGLALSIDFDAGLEPWVVADGARLRQIVSNLASNAIKFTATGGVRIHVSTRRTAQGLRLRIMVADSGIGFDRETGRRLFEPFSQADDSITRRFGGTGLGLSICRSLAALMGGSIRARSSPGQGSVFCVSLPVDAAAADMMIGQAAAPRPEKLSILLVEDNPTNQAVVRCLLEPFGVDLTIASNGREALRYLHTGALVDTVLMDIQMPIMDGLTAVAEIRGREIALGRPRLPIAMLTANTSESQRREAIAVGADAVIAKPVTAESLLQGIADLMSTDARKAAA